MSKEEFIRKLLEVYDASEGGKELIANQGQALDGYSELANYRDIIQAYKGKK